MGQRRMIRDRLPMPRNAWRIADARADGMRPQHPVMVSYVGDTPWDTPTVYVDSGMRYDWGWAKDLQAYIVIAEGQEIDITDAVHSLYDPFADHYVGIIDLKTRAVAFVVGVQPLKLWHVKDTSEYFQEVH